MKDLFKLNLNLINNKIKFNYNLQIQGLESVNQMFKKFFKCLTKVLKKIN